MEVISFLLLVVFAFTSMGLFLLYIFFPTWIFLPFIFILTLLGVILLIWNIYLIYYSFKALLNGAPYAATPHTTVSQMISLAEIKKSDTMLDIGSGDGRIVIEASKHATKCIGIEIHPFHYWKSRLKCKALGLQNTQILRGNFWYYDFSHIDVLTLFFIPHKMKKLMEKIAKEMKPGSRIISYAFTFPDWQYTKNDDKIYVYIL